MTDRHNGFLVILGEDTRDDDAERIFDAIKMIKGVLDVKPHVAGFEDAIATRRAKQELINKLYEVLGEWL